MSLLFDRRAEVVIATGPRAQAISIPLGAGDVTGRSPLETTVPNRSPAVRAAYPLRIQFHIEKQAFLAPNTGSITITNLRKETRGSIQQWGVEVELRAGYLDQGILPMVFKGTSRTVDHVRQGSEWLTRIQLGDGENAYRYAQAVYSAGPGTSARKVVADLADTLRAFGIDTKKFVAQVQEGLIPLAVEQFKTGFAMQGPVLRSMEKLLAPSVQMSIQNGEVRAVLFGSSTPIPAFKISADSGMLGSPEHGSPDQDELNPVLKVVSLLLPQIQPGDPFVVGGESVKGVYRADKVTHTGDTHGGDWQTEIEGRQISDAVEVKP